MLMLLARDTSVGSEALLPRPLTLPAGLPTEIPRLVTPVFPLTLLALALTLKALDDGGAESEPSGGAGGGGGGGGVDVEVGGGEKVRRGT